MSRQSLVASNLYPTVKDYTDAYHPRLPVTVDSSADTTDSAFLRVAVPATIPLAASQPKQPVLNTMGAFSPLYPFPTAATQAPAFYPANADITQAGPPAFPSPSLPPYLSALVNTATQGAPGVYM